MAERVASLYIHNSSDFLVLRRPDLQVLHGDRADHHLSRKAPAPLDFGP
jgi:hypothetical protein